MLQLPSSQSTKAEQTLNTEQEEVDNNSSEHWQSGNEATQSAAHALKRASWSGTLPAWVQLLGPAQTTHVRTTEHTLQALHITDGL
jgi:hypothetical protein